MSIKLPSPSDPALLRSLNRRTILRTLFDSDSLETLAGIVKKTGVSRPTVEASLAELAEQKWIEELSPDSSGPGRLGRPARRFRFRNEFGILVGLDLGIHKILVKIADTRGTVLHEHVYRMDGTSPEQLTVGKILEEVRAAINESGHRGSRIWAMGCGFPGVVTAAGVVQRSVVVPHLTGVNLAAELSEQLNTVVLVENDANLATLAEHREGASHDARSVVVVKTGRRISSGLIINGALLRGHHGAAGEIGALPILRWAEAPKLKDVVEYGQALGAGLAALVLAVDPEAVVIQGEFKDQEAALLAAVRTELDRFCIYTPSVQVSKLGAGAVAAGGVHLAGDRFRTDVLGLSFAQ
ncbi:ROK family protein [Pseudarthrobacter sp. J64]|uniref:ROK family protein n=1 Tax=Pseudarthrobacter sp. J64 TaxID=3116485 RepID=UPI002E81D713|nr:ROK family protein [Pseudarthrobacter sp. J64]MEE2568913.1 ROK family protein [Pseudarthrobacter sp. J64]